MRPLLIATAVAVAASLGGVLSTASAAAPVAVSIAIMPTHFFPQEIGTWSASGAVNDSGSFVRTEVHGTGSLPNSFEPEHTGAFQEVFVLSDSDRTLTLRVQSLLTTSGVTAVWEVVSGTGAYEGASGHGKGAFNGPTLTLLLTGVISKAG